MSMTVRASRPAQSAAGQRAPRPPSPRAEQWRPAGRRGVPLLQSLAAKSRRQYRDRDQCRRPAVAGTGGYLHLPHRRAHATDVSTARSGPCGKCTGCRPGTLSGWASPPPAVAATSVSPRVLRSSPALAAPPRWCASTSAVCAASACRPVTNCPAPRSPCASITTWPSATGRATRTR